MAFHIQRWVKESADIKVQVIIKHSNGRHKGEKRDSEG
jgi:hypothetical protein